MKRYLVTWSDNYYPCSGCHDWVQMFVLFEQASTFAEGFAKAKDNSGRVVIIELDLNNLTFKEVLSIKTDY